MRVRLRNALYRFCAKHLVSYRVPYLMGFNDCFPVYALGPLRARLFGIRVPVLWAYDMATQIEKEITSIHSADDSAVTTEKVS